MSGLENTQSKQSSGCSSCCNNFVLELVQSNRELVQAIKAQNEVMSQIMDQNSELIAMMQTDDEGAEAGYLSD